MLPYVMTAADPTLDYWDEIADTQGARGYLHWLSMIALDTRPERKCWRDAAEDWQKEREARRAGALEAVAGFRDDYAGPRRFWSGCAKGNDKTTGVARRLIWLLGYARHAVHSYVCSGSKEQAALVRLAMEAEVERNQFLRRRVDISDYHAEGASGSRLTILPMQHATGQGIFPDYVVADELTHWQHEEGREFWNFVVASINKRPHCVFEVLTNAGYKGSWQHQVRNAAEAASREPDPRWDFFEQPAWSPLAGWMDERAIAEDSKLMSDGERDRLHGNRWIDPGEEQGYITLDQAEACVDPHLYEKSHGDPRKFEYYAVVDYGTGNVLTKRDRTALCVMHPLPGRDDVEIDRLDCWEDRTGGRVPVNADPHNPDARSVEGWLDTVLRQFGRVNIVLDPHQMLGLAEKYERRGRRVLFFEFQAGKKNFRMAQVLRTMVLNRKVRWSPGAGLLPGAEDDTFAKELSRLVLKEMSYGFRYDHKSGRHDDRAAAVGMGLVTCVPEVIPTGSLGPKTQKPTPPVPALVPGPRRDWAAARGLFGMR